MLWVLMDRTYRHSCYYVITV